MDSCSATAPPLRTPRSLTSRGDYSARPSDVSGHDERDISTSMSMVTIVVATRNRVDTLRQSLFRLTALAAPVIVVDNASTDGTETRVRDEFPDVTVIRRPRNEGAVARNHGVAAAC